MTAPAGKLVWQVSLKSILRTCFYATINILCWYKNQLHRILMKWQWTVPNRPNLIHKRLQNAATMTKIIKLLCHFGSNWAHLTFVHTLQSSFFWCTKGSTPKGQFVRYGKRKHKWFLLSDLFFFLVTQ